MPKRVTRPVDRQLLKKLNAIVNAARKDAGLKPLPKKLPKNLMNEG